MSLSLPTPTLTPVGHGTGDESWDSEKMRPSERIAEQEVLLSTMNSKGPENPTLTLSVQPRTFTLKLLKHRFLYSLAWMWRTLGY